ncbi:MAG: response regulator [Dehalococcoidales bacterium]|nr:response regulator [Dehalococcoidales bacterium]
MNNSILIINNTAAPQVLAGILGRAGFGVETVPDMFTGLERLGARDYGVTIVLEKPEADSRTVCEKIRGVTGCPLIVISANASTETCIQAIRAGADYFLRKPFGPLEFLARIKSLLQRTSSRQPAHISFQAQG